MEGEECLHISWETKLVIVRTYCMHVYVYVCICVCVCVHLCLCMCASVSVYMYELRNSFKLHYSPHQLEAILAVRVN